MNGLDRIREAAERDRDLRFTNLMHHLTAELLRGSYGALKHNAVAGVDDVTRAIVSPYVARPSPSVFGQSSKK